MLKYMAAPERLTARVLEFEADLPSDTHSRHTRDFSVVTSLAECGHVDMLEYVMHHAPRGAEELERRTKRGDEPVLMAATAGQLGVLEFLARHCPSGARVLETRDRQTHYSVVHQAAAAPKNRLEMLRFLVENAPSGAAILETVKDATLARPIFAAIRRDDADAVEFIAEHSPRGAVSELAEAIDYMGQSALHYAVAYRSFAVLAYAVRRLGVDGAKIAFFQVPPPAQNRPQVVQEFKAPVSDAVAYGYTDVLSFFLQHMDPSGAFLENRFDGSKDLVHAAISFKNVRTLQFLVEHAPSGWRTLVMPRRRHMFDKGMSPFAKAVLDQAIPVLKYVFSKGIPEEELCNVPDVKSTLHLISEPTPELFYVDQSRLVLPPWSLDNLAEIAASIPLQSLVAFLRQSIAQWRGEVAAVVFDHVLSKTQESPTYFAPSSTCLQAWKGRFEAEQQQEEKEVGKKKKKK